MKVKHKGKRVKVNRVVDLSTAYSITQTIKDACFDKSGKYMPAYFDLLWKRAILIAYTDLELPDDLSDIYDFIYEEPGFFDRVKRKIDPDQYQSIRLATREAIDDERDVYAEEMRKDLESARHVLVDLSSELEEATEAAKIFESEDIQELLHSLQDSAKHTREAAADKTVVADIKGRVK